MSIAVVTGASSGMGREFAKRIAKKEKEISCIWLIARRKERLEQLAEELNMAARVVVADLTDKDGLSRLEVLIKEETPDIGILVNGAGCAKIGNADEICAEDIMRMIDLNCRGAVMITQMCIPYMKKGGRIIELCSTAAFQPFPSLNVYAASKAFLYRYSRALRIELLPRGVHVTAVCPYWVKDSEFIENAKETEKKRIYNFALAGKSRTVVMLALNDSKLGLPVSTPGPVCFVHRIAAKVIPGEIMIWIWELLKRL